MQKPFFMRPRIEISRLVPILEVGKKTETGNDVVTQGLVVRRQQHPPTQTHQDGADSNQRWHDAARPVQVKAQQGEAPLLQPSDHDARHQEAGDHEENIDPDKASAETADTEVIEHH